MSQQYVVAAQRKVTKWRISPMKRGLERVGAVKSREEKALVIEVIGQRVRLYTIGSVSLYKILGSNCVALEQVVQRGSGCSIFGHIQGEAGQGSE